MHHMDYLTNYYKNLSEELQKRLTLLEQFKSSFDAAFPNFNKRPSMAPTLPRRDYKDVAREAQRTVAQRRDNIPGMPKLSANIKFSRGTREGIPVSDEEAMQYNLSPEERQQAARSTSLTPQSDLYSFMKLSQQEREDIAPGLPTNILRGMEQEQYARSRNAVNMGRADQKLGTEKVAALNTISQTLEDRKGPLGGKAGADTYFERVRRNVSPEDVNRALEAKNLPELGAMQDAGTRVAKKEFAQTGRMTPETYQAVRTIETARDEALERKIRDTQDLLASREEAAKKMYGDQWMRYM